MNRARTLASILCLLSTMITLEACAQPQTSLPPTRLADVAEQPSRAAPTPVDFSSSAEAIDMAHAAALEAANAEAAKPAFAQATLALDAAISATDARIGSVWRQDPAPLDYHSVLESWKKPSGSLSAGSTSRGLLLGSQELAFDGDHHTIIPRARPRNTRFGHPTMLAILKDSGEAVARQFPGSKIAIGNIAYKNGGDIRWSVSHNSGRDADIAFYVKDAKTGTPLEAAPDLVTFEENGVSMGGGEYLFDVERNWALAKALLTHDKAQIQYIFISAGLKQMLLDHARELGEPAEIRARAEDALKQPTDSSPHNDHFHLRLTCDLEDRLRGCVDRGPRWEWVDWHDRELLERTIAMLPGLQDPDPATRLEVLAYIDAIQSPAAPEVALLIAAYNDDPEVRERAVGMARGYYAFDGAAIVGMQRLIRSGSIDDSSRAKLYALLRRSLDPWTIPFVKEQLADRALSPAEKAWAARALSHQMEPELVPYILEQLMIQPPEVKQELALVLRRITNHSEAIVWDKASVDELEKAHAKWTGWWESNRQFERERWVAQGMKEIGVEPNFFKAYTAVDTMLTALPSAPDHLVYNINRSLREITGRWAPLEQTDGKKLQDYWKKWWSKHRKRLLSTS
ncbi:MAG: penicillin-insensitive murein endopeptidase [Myxococcota bacterium]|nr:penicillin-insensitive murein endopeptidase [Myxococcota bacterium]